jgi:purine-binding chemotaxis protein CheW
MVRFTRLKKGETASMQATQNQYAIPEQNAAADRRTTKYLTFHVGTEEFAIAVLSVREIMGVQDITAVPHTPSYIKGIINLRGKVVPVVDLRLKFGLPATEYTQRTCIIVVEVAGESAPLLMGAVVDSVSEVLNVASSEVEKTPDFGEGVTIPYLLGIAKSKGNVTILLDIDKVLANSELSGISNLVH